MERSEIREASSPFPHIASAHAGYGSLQDFHRGDVSTNGMPDNLRQRPALSQVMAQPPFPGRARIAEHDLRHGCALQLPLKPAVDQPRFRRRLHAGAGTLHARLAHHEAGRRHGPHFLPAGLFLHGVGPAEDKGASTAILAIAGRR